MKKLVLFSLIVILLFVLASCSSQQDYDQLSNEYHELESKYEALYSKYEDLSVDYNKLFEESIDYQEAYYKLEDYYYQDDYFRNAEDALLYLIEYFDEGKGNRDMCYNAVFYLYKYIDNLVGVG